MKTYRDAGVDIDAGKQFVESLKPLVKTTYRDGVIGTVGGFGGLFNLSATNYKNPLLVAATDGVGTKMQLARKTKRYDRIGIDLVAMCVNDVLTHGAEPLFFLDYLATPTLNQDEAREVVSGIAQGCRIANCALLGGETAEMPGLVQKGDYELAGFCVGAVERNRVLPKKETIKEGDTLIGLESSGLHANGFSLVRHFMDKQDLTCDSPFADTTKSLGDVLTIPTRIYVRPLLELLRQDAPIKALAHITGGGLDNIPRVLPSDLTAHLKIPPLPPVMSWLKGAANIADEEFARVFNCGIGMVLVVAPEQESDVLSALQKTNETAYVIGHVASGDGGVQIAW